MAQGNTRTAKVELSSLPCLLSSLAYMITFVWDTTVRAICPYKSVSLGKNMKSTKNGQ